MLHLSRLDAMKIHGRGTPTSTHTHWLTWLTKVLLAAFSEQARALFWLGLIDQQSLTPSSWLGGYYWSPIQLRAACYVLGGVEIISMQEEPGWEITGLTGESKEDWQFIVRCYGNQMLRLMVSYISCSVSVFGFQVEQSDMSNSKIPKWHWNGTL